MSSGQGKVKVSGLVLTAALVGCGAMLGCNYNEMKPGAATAPQRSGTDPATPQPDTRALDYQTVKAAVFEPVCLQCHSGPNPPRGLSWETYDVIFANITRIRERVAAGTMPPPRFMTLSPDQKELLLAWIDAGAPETAEENTTPNQ